MDSDEALKDALRLAVDPPGGVGVEALRELTRGDEQADWDIATAAAHLGVSAHTLRYYERIGLVEIPRDEVGHRRFAAPAVRRLVFLTRMRASGMPISDLRHYVALVDAGQHTVPERLDALLTAPQEVLLREDHSELGFARPTGYGSARGCNR